MRRFPKIAAVSAVLMTFANSSGAAAERSAISLPPEAETAKTAFDAALSGSACDPSTGTPTKVLLDAIADWLETDFQLRNVAGRHPNVALVPASCLIAMRYGAFFSDRSIETDRSTQPQQADVVLAIYKDAEETIYLPEVWSGRTPAELSTLVHEMVHHFQNLAGQKFVCPEEREKLAFEAQQRWLGLFGRSLESEFEIEKMTLLVRTSCFF
jgi:hypothetical protein